MQVNELSMFIFNTVWDKSLTTRGKTTALVKGLINVCGEVPNADLVCS